jgi:hypothetical protein
MKRKKKDREKDGRFEDLDYHGYYKSARKSEKRNRRHNAKNNVRDITRGGMTPEEYEEYYNDDNN